MSNKSSYLPALVGALGVHVFIGAFIFTSFHERIQVASLPKVQSPEPIIEAVSIDESELNQEIARLESIEKKKKDQEAQRKRKLEKERAELKRKAEREKAELARIKKEKERVAREAERKAKEKELAQKKKLEEEKLALEQLKKEQQQAKKAKEEALAEAKQVEAQKKQAELELKQAEELAKKKELARLEKEKENRRQRALLISNQINQFFVLIADKVVQNWRQPLGPELANLECDLSVRLSETGEVLEAVVTRSSGNIEFDRSSELAVMKASPFPMPSDPIARENFYSFTFNFKPGTLS